MGDEQLQLSATRVIAGKVKTTRRGLRLERDLDFEEWKSVGDLLSTLNDASRWWLGDWLVYGEARYPARYRDAANETTLGYQTLRNYAWVARAFPTEERRMALSFQHHAEVASLTKDQRERWLDRAERFSWSRNVLRNHLRASRKSAAGELEAASVRLAVSIPHEKQQRWEAAAEDANMSLHQWIVATLENAADTAPATPQLKVS